MGLSQLRLMRFLDLCLSCLRLLVGLSELCLMRVISLMALLLQLLYTLESSCECLTLQADSITIRTACRLPLGPQ